MTHEKGNPVKSLSAARVSFSAYLFFAATAWIYIWLRAWFIPFQSDEAATFFMYVQPGHLFPPFSHIDANNHILNSILTWISFQFFGSSPLALRLPNILAAPVYLYFIFRLAELINWNIAKWGFILLSAGTHFLLEFFSYSRGYGLSMAFMAGAIYQLIVLCKEIRIKNIILAVLFTLLAVSANLNLIFISLAVYFFLAFILFRARSESRNTQLAGVLFVMLTGGLSSAYFIYDSFLIRKVAGFYYGSSTGFFKVTVESLSAMVAGRFITIIEILAVSAFAVTVFAVIILLSMKKMRFHILNWGTFFLALLLVSWISSLLLNQIWKVNFQEDRAAMQLIPLFYGMVFFGLDSLNPVHRRYISLAFIPLALILVFSIQQASLKQTVYGSSQQIPAEYFKYIKDDASGKPFPPVISSYQARRQGWAFMNFRSGGSLNPLTVSGFPNPSADYLIHEFPLPDSLKNIFEPVLTDQNTQTALYRNIAPPVIISSVTHKMENPVDGQNEYYNLFKVAADSLTGKSIRLETELEVESPWKPLQAAVVAEVLGRNRKQLAYEAIDLDQLQPSWDKEHHSFRHVIMIHDIPQGTEMILLYFWNKKKAPVSISGGSTIIIITN